MPTSLTPTTVTPGAIVTVAYLKAQIDSKNDHLGLFMPLLMDVLNGVSTNSVSTVEVQESLYARYGLAIPQHVASTLLKRAVKARWLRRESGRFFRTTKPLPATNVQAEQIGIKEGQRRLGSALCRHAAKRNLQIPSEEEAVDLLLRFLEAQQVGLLLGSKLSLPAETDPDHRHAAIIAEFVQDVVRDDAALLSILKHMIEGLVLYHAAFLPDLDPVDRKFRDLRVIFDSSLVRQALGYEGHAMRVLMFETLEILREVGVHCLVCEKSIAEIRRILAAFERKLATAKGQQSLGTFPMARHFLTERISPSDVRQMSALLEKEIATAGFQIIRLPKRVKEHTLGEGDLIKRLSSRQARTDDIEPRVDHDVDCIAGVLQMRAGVRSSRLEEVGAVFATDSRLVIRNTRLWWTEDEHETGVEPVVHIRALTNLAWLKKPSLKADFKVIEIVALCSAALRPSPEVWEKFLRHLESLNRSDKLSSDEVTAILVSAMSDDLLREAEETAEGPDDIDAVTLDEIIERVKLTYAENSKRDVEAVKATLGGRLESLGAQYEKTAGESRRTAEFLEARAHLVAKVTTTFLRILANLLVLWGAWSIISEHPIESTVYGKLTLIGASFFVVLETLAHRTHVSRWLSQLESYISTGVLRWFSPPSPQPRHGTRPGGVDRK